MKLLSVTVPAYNVEKTLSNTLDSLCVQNLLEYLDIIIVNDGSTDQTSQIGEEYMRKFPGSVRLINKDNGGHGSAVNAGIQEALGLYFKVVDGDDRLEKSGLIELIECLKKTSADLIVAHYKKVPFNDKEAKSKLMRFGGMDFNRIYQFEELPPDVNIYFGIHSITIRTSILKEHQIKLQEHTFYVDAEYGLLPIPYIKTVLFIDQYVYLYFVGNPQQSIDPAQFVRRYEDHLRVVQRMVQFANESACQGTRQKYIYTVLQKLCFTQYMLSAYYDNDTQRGKIRARNFDKWLLNMDLTLYRMLDKSLYIRCLRLTGFHFLPRGEKLKQFIKKSYTFVKPLFKRKRKLTY